jgi:ACS family tartrate transporter-like MFS transporter
VNLRALRRKLMWRIVPLVFVLYVISYLDRANLAFVLDEMRDPVNGLGFSSGVFGTGYGLFFVGYLLLEIPGALLVEHWSARKWFSRIMLTWGVCSMGFALVREPWQFYLARFLLGLAEAGFFPGIIVYFTHWFPRADRARALAGMILAVPLSQALGAWMTQQILKINWFDLAGWQWVFLVEGFPAIVMGVAVLYLMTDRPRQATWLSRAEADWLEETLAAERRAASAAGLTLGQVLLQPAVWLLALGILATNTGGYAFGSWIMDAFRTFLRETQGAEATREALSQISLYYVFPSVEEVVAELVGEPLFWIGLFYVFGLAGVWVAGQSSDRSGERKWHCIAGQVLTACCLAASLIPGQSWALVFFWLALTGFFAYFWPPPFWVLPTQALSASAAALAIGIINICANVSGIIGPTAVGWMKMWDFDVRSCLFVSVAGYAAGGVIIALLRVHPTSAPKV